MDTDFLPQNRIHLSQNEFGLPQIEIHSPENVIRLRQNAIGF